MTAGLAESNDLLLYRTHRFFIAVTIASTAFIHMGIASLSCPGAGEGGSGLVKYHKDFITVFYHVAVHTTAIRHNKICFRPILVLPQLCGRLKIGYTWVLGGSVV